MAKIDKQPRYTNREGFTSHDLSHEVDFSSSCGHLIPVCYDFLQPGERVDLQFNLKTRTEPLDAAAFVDIEECIDTFFVPINQLYHPFQSQFYGIEDVNSDFYSLNPSGIFGQLSPTLPYVSQATLRDFIRTYASDTETSMYQTGTTFRTSWQEVVRMIDMFNIPVLAWAKGNWNSPAPGETRRIVDLDLTQSVNLLFPAAYQKIWMDYYRNTDYVANDPQAYNLDSFYAQLTEMNDNNRLSKLFKLRRVPYAPDFLTNVKPSPIFGGASVGATGNNAAIYQNLNQWLSNANTSRPLGLTGSTEVNLPDANSATPTTVGFVPQSSTSNATRGDLTRFMNPANIRTLFAVERLAEVTRRAGKHYDAQTLAHFGVNVPTGIEGQAYFVGHHQQNLQIGDVVSTAGTESQALGTIAGRGFSYDRGGHNRFTAPCHGILMSVMYVRPKVKYKPVALDRVHQYLYPNDFYHPEFDNLGMQPLFQAQVNENGITAAENAAILGWQYRYMELKKKRSVVHGSLAGSQSYWTFSRQMDTVNSDNLYVSPSDLNELFLIQYSEQLLKPYVDGFASENPRYYTDVFERDNFKHSLFVNYRKASRMSTYGLPNLNQMR